MHRHPHIGTGLEPRQEELDAVNAAIKLTSELLLPAGTELKTADGEVLRVLYYGQGGRFTIVQPVVRAGGCEVGGLSRKESRLTAKLYSYAEIVAIPLSAPPFHSWRRRRFVRDSKGEELERRVLGMEV